MLQKKFYQFVNIGYPLFDKFMTQQVYLYLATGAINTALNMGLFGLFMVMLQNQFLAVEISTLLAFVITVFTGFWFSKNFAFKQQASINDQQKQFRKYTLVALQSQFNGYLITKTLIAFLSFKPVVAYFTTASIMLTLNYFLQKFYSFKTTK
jgi:putative flippase GtrA